MPGTTKIPLTHRTRTLPLADAVTTARTWWTAHHLVPDGADRQLQADVTLVLAEAASTGLRTLQDLLDHAVRVITALTGVDNISQYCTAVASHHTHRVRNAIGALAAGATIASGDNPATALGDLPHLPPRAGGRGRPVHSDEIVLLRHVALHAVLAGGAAEIAATRYALVESGALPSEATMITPADFDDPHQPSKVTLPGVRQRASERTVTLGPWAANVLRAALDIHRARHSAMTHALAYTGTSQAGGYAASASASSALARMIDNAGLADPGLEPASILRWRILRVVERHGAKDAIAMSGKQSLSAVYTFLNIPLPPRTPLPTHGGYL